MKRHKKAMGGGINPKDDKPSFDGGNADVEKEAKKDAGKNVGVVGGVAARRLDRARGGRVGADKSPLSANSSKNPITSAGKC